MPAERFEGPLTEPSFAEIVAIDPAIGRIIGEGRRSGGSWPEFEKYKRQLSRHVGWGSARIELSTGEVYELVMGELTKAMNL